MELKEISGKELDEYVFNSNKSHYLQTSTWGEVNRKRGLIPHYLQLVDDNKIIGSAMLLEKIILNYRTFYCPRGFICDYDNKENIKNMVNYLKEYVNKHKGLYLKIDPDIIIRKLNAEAQPIEIFEDKLKLIDYLESLGGKHRGFTTKFSQSSMPRFTFRMDVTQNNLIDTFHDTTRKIIRRDNPYNIKVYIGDKNDLEKFYQIMKDTSIRKHIYVENIEFYESFYYTLHDNNMSDLYIATINVKELIDTYETYINNVQSEIDTINKTNKKGKLIDLNNKLIKYNKELNEIKSLNKEEIILSSIITAKFKDTVWTIHGANANELPFLNANYEIYWKIIQDAKSQGYKCVDLYGAEGDIDKTSSAYGIFNFKVRLGGDFDEFIGEFDFITKPLANSIISILLKIRRKLKYQLQKIN